MQANWRMRRCRLLAAAILLGCLAPFGSVPLAAQSTFNEREVKSAATAQDKAGVWAFDFRFKDPRIIKVNYPGRGTRLFLYMWYQVINRTGEPQKFYPEFELVTLTPPTVYSDEVLPLVQEAIKRVEDPTGYQDIKNSVEIAKEPIPLSKPADQAFPKAVTGVAIWDITAADPAKRDPKAKDLSTVTNFSIFVRGLSNGFVEVDPVVPGGPTLKRTKTLQLNFKRQGNIAVLDSRDISFEPPADWVYRAPKVRDRKEPEKKK